MAEIDVTPKIHSSRKPRKSYAPKSQRTEANLTMEQEAFCRARAMGMNLKEACTLAGLSVAPATARDWERERPEIRRRTEELSKLATENAMMRNGLTRSWVIERLMTVVERCMQNEPVKDKEGNETGEFMFNAAGANQALKMLGDTMGMFKHTDKTDEDEYANLSDEDIARIAADLAQQTGLLIDGTTSS